ncbi:uncharacterized protein [Montipora foliosa]|uniref:uncharacterized protein n=1 Tax=Montipora foliosa TaxID=591990 RepID=UPI0035F19B50
MTASDAGTFSLCKDNNADLLDSKISYALYEIQKLEVIKHELSNLQAKSKVYTRHGAGNLFFLSNRPLVIAEFKRKLDNSIKELAQLSKQKQEGLLLQQDSTG